MTKFSNIRIIYTHMYVHLCSLLYHSASNVRTYTSGNIYQISLCPTLSLSPHSLSYLTPNITSLTLASEGAPVSQVADILISCGRLSLMSIKRMVTLWKLIICGEPESSARTTTQWCTEVSGELHVIRAHVHKNVCKVTWVHF